MVTELERYQAIIKKEKKRKKEEAEARKARAVAKKEEAEAKAARTSLQKAIDAHKETRRQIKEVSVKGYKVTKPYRKEALRKTKRLAKKVGKIIEEGSTKKLGSAIEKALKQGQPRSTNRKKRLAIAQERNRRLQLQLQMERRTSAEQLAAQQRASYEQGEVPYYPEQPIQQEQIVEDDYGREVRQQQGPSKLQSFFRMVTPTPGVMDRLGNIGGTQKRGEQIRTRKGRSNIIQQQPTILNAPRMTLFQSQLNKPKDNLKW